MKSLNTVYVPEMYRHGKVSWILDMALRLAIVIAVIFDCGETSNSMEKSGQMRWIEVRLNGKS